MIAQILERLQTDSEFETVHWPFFFSRDLRTIRRGGLGKIIELVRCLWRLLCIRVVGDIDLLLYPAGGPHLVPIIRDICLLPFARLASKRLVIQFHAAGIADALKTPNIFHRILVRIMRQADTAIVMTNYNRIDPESVGIQNTVILPYLITDEATGSFSRHEPRLIYVGHLCADKGTPELLSAFSDVVRDHPDLRLQLIGEPLVPYDWQTLKETVERLRIEGFVDLPGVLTGAAKWRAFEEAALFVFPSVAPYESFGLVLAEAMMFGLPILATDWRGNGDVLGDPPGGIVFPSGPQLARQIEWAIREALTRRNEWESWGRRNRKRFESHFKHTLTTSQYINFVQRELAANV
jgi:glycosyltransferase involved in cell wall biosynthesis